MSLKSFLKKIINMCPAYRQRERQSQYLQQLIQLNKDLLYYRIRENCMVDDVLKISLEGKELYFYLPCFPRNYTSLDIIANLNFAEREELDHVKQYIKPGSVIADIGANIGNHTLYFAHYLSPLKIHSFEPQKTMFDILSKNCELNQLQDKVQLYNYCLGEREAVACLNTYDLKNAGGASFTISDSSSGYKMITLDSLKLDRLDFMKVDVEGYELNVLKGSEEAIKRCRPVIWCEALTEAHKNSLKQYLKTLGYSMSFLSETNYLFLP